MNLQNTSAELQWKQRTELKETERNVPLVIKTPISYLIGWWDGVDFYSQDGQRLALFVVLKVLPLEEQVVEIETPFLNL